MWGFSATDLCGCFLLVFTSLYHEHTACHIRNMSRCGFWLFYFFFPFCGSSLVVMFYFLLCTSIKAVEVFQKQRGGKGTFCVNRDIKLKMKKYVVCHLEYKTSFDVALIQKRKEKNPPSKKSIRALHPFTCLLFFRLFLLSLLPPSPSLPSAPCFVPGTFCFSYKLTSLMWLCVSFPSRLAAVLATE